MTTIVSGSLSEADHHAQLRRAVIASTIGTTIEWYDFLLYSQVTGLVFAKLYFPASDPLIGALQAFSIYAVGFVARPIGAAIFGHFGDRIGRKAALIATLLLTGIATFAVGFVPSYAQIGVWGAIILTILRFIQGVGVGGEWGGQCCCRWSGQDQTPIADSSRRGRNLARRPGCSWRIWPCWYSARFPATNSWSGGGASRFS
jgi:hypothetical protein